MAQNTHSERPLVPLETVQRRNNVAMIALNVWGALLVMFYFNTIAPLPTGEAPLGSLEAGSVALSLLVVGGTLAIGFIWGSKREARIKEWYARLREDPTIDVPVDVRRDVLNTPWYSTLITAIMWSMSGVITAIMSGSWRLILGVTGIGGIFTSAMSYFVVDLFWRPVIPHFFPQGELHEVRAFRPTVLGRFLVVFLLVGIYLPAILVSLTWSRARALVSATNPDVVLRNLFFLELFILGFGILASIGLAIFMTRGIVAPLERLQTAMKHVEQHDFDVRVPVVTNDELGYLGEQFNQMTAGLRLGERLRTLLNLYISPEVAREALEHGAKLGGNKVACTVLFSDIRSFTSLSEQLPPEALIDLLNRYMMAMVEVIVAHDGIVNKFGGDSLLAVFGTPLNPLADHAACAVRAAQGMQRALADFNAAQTAQNGPTLKIGVGIASGPVIAGNVGGRERIEYTVIGDTVNLASRLEGKTKEVAADILLNQRAFELASQYMTLQATALPPMPIKGKRDPVTVYAIAT